MTDIDRLREFLHNQDEVLSRQVLPLLIAYDEAIDRIKELEQSLNKHLEEMQNKNDFEAGC